MTVVNRRTMRNTSLRNDLIYLPALLMDMSVGSVVLGVTYFASRLGASSLIIGIMASASTLLYVIFCQVFGRLSDRVSRKRIPQLACAALSILYFLNSGIVVGFGILRRYHLKKVFTIVRKVSPVFLVQLSFSLR